jgi:hypothetical protein
VRQNWDMISRVDNPVVVLNVLILSRSVVYAEAPAFSEMRKTKEDLLALYCYGESSQVD